MKNVTAFVLLLIGTLALLVATLMQSRQIENLDRDTKRPAVDIVTVEIVAHTPGLYFDGWETLNIYEASRVPDDASTYTITDIISCKEGFAPLATWYDIIGSWPSIDVMYSVNPRVVDDGEIQISLRTRQVGHWSDRGEDGPDDHRGYAYVEVFLLCLHSAVDEPVGSK